jgi:hypothetical protein
MVKDGRTAGGWMGDTNKNGRMSKDGILRKPALENKS